MNKISAKLTHLAAMIDGWNAPGGVPELERDLALELLREIYVDIKFGQHTDINQHASQADDLQSARAASVSSGAPADDACVEPDNLQTPLSYGTRESAKVEPSFIAPRRVAPELIRSLYGDDEAIEAIGAVESPGTVKSLGAVEAVESIEVVEPPMSAEAVEAVESPEAIGAVESPKTIESPKAVEAPRAVEAAGAVESPEPPEAPAAETEIVAEPMPEPPSLAQGIAGRIYYPEPEPQIEEKPQPKPEPDDEPIFEVTELGPTTTLADSIATGRKTLGETLRTGSERDMASHLAAAERPDLSRSIGLNDRFLMIRDMFDGNAAEFDRVISRLDTFTELDEAAIWIRENFNWNADSPGVSLLVGLLERKLGR